MAAARRHRDAVPGFLEPFEAHQRQRRRRRFLPTCGNTYGDNTADLAYGQATWLGRVEYKVTKDILTFASVTTGFHSPAIGDGGATTKPEKLTSYEIGFKSDLFDRKLTLNLDAFWICLLYTSPSPRDLSTSRMPSSA